MAHKLSPHKASRIMELYFQGHSQPEIAGRLNVDQSTVSLYVTRFKHLAGEEGLKAAGKEFNMVDQVQALHSLAEELKASHLSVEEARAGLKMEALLQTCGIEPEQYKDVAQACVRMKAEGFISAAVRLAQLEASTGLGYLELVARCESAYEQLGKTEEDLQAVTAKLGQVKGELASIEKQKESAGQDLKARMEQLGLDTKRLKKVEELAATLKEAGVSDEEMEGFTQRQRLLAEAGITLDVFAAILQQAKALTSHDQGKGLLDKLSEYGGLTGAIGGLKDQIQSLGKQAQGMEEKAVLNAQLEADLVKLRAEKATLEPCVKQLAEEKEALTQIRARVEALQKKEDALEADNREKETRRDLLAGELETLQQKTVGLRDVDKQTEAASARLAEITSRMQGAGNRWEIFEGLVGLVGSRSRSDLATFLGSLPELVEEAKTGKYSTDVLRSFVLERLTGGTLKSLICTSCGARFVVDKPPREYSDYECPACHLSYSVKVDRDALQILRPALAPPQVTSTAPVVVMATSQPKVLKLRVPTSVPVEKASPVPEPKQHP